MERSTVILRCALLRASKDALRVQMSHPSRLAEDGEHLRMTPVMLMQG